LYPLFKYQVRGTPIPLTSTSQTFSSFVTSCEWSVHLNHNITKGEFGYDLLFWSATETIVKIEFILKEGTQETIMASKDLTISYISYTSAVQHHLEIDTNPLDGTNPKSGIDGATKKKIQHPPSLNPYNSSLELVRVWGVLKRQEVTRTSCLICSQ
jgi:hypothetical protein